eukprot:m.354392 g.354392  ORF g.354392 m.354392 type:complete len:259 (-) comp17007_c0_seq1:1548-2324(-)
MTYLVAAAVAALVVATLAVEDVQLAVPEAVIHAIRGQLTAVEGDASALRAKMRSTERTLDGLRSTSLLSSQGLTSAQSLNSVARNAADDEIMSRLQTLQRRVDELERLGQPMLRNAHECYWYALNDGRDQGTVVTCPFTKKFNDTVLRLSWLGSARAICNGCEKGYRININDDLCYAPVDIDSSLHESSGQDNHRMLHLTGFCVQSRHGPITQGSHILSLYTYGSGDGYAGWDSSSRIIIEEVPGAQMSMQLQSTQRA